MSTLFISSSKHYTTPYERKSRNSHLKSVPRSTR